MCEFKVFDQEQVVARDIVHANLSNGALVLKDVLGSATSVEGGVVMEIDVAKETIRLQTDPIIGDVLRFIYAVARCEESNRYDNGLEDIWQRAKSRGDERIRELWRKCEKPRQE